MDLVSKAQNIILKPRESWIAIKTEDTPVKDLFTSYAVILAAIPAIAHFIGLGMVGRNIPFVGWYRYSLGSAFLYMILSYAFSLLSVYIVGFIINALASTFNSTPNLNKAMALAVYSMTPYWVAGVLYIVPYLGILVMLAGLYGLYVLYLGFAEGMLETPQEKVLPFFIVSLVVTIVIFIIISIILRGIFAVGAVSGAY
ncbi:MAG: hypothetical protein B5M54_00830 [Candidatus Aminicenantes bacterium 4484_214]|nr:MAG: hypothetical protein B5M54_00830 [Candidatus Aminicenantes bacterium 4484_214]RLE11001.1 MAG: hypothetical protein DRJ06_00105 [Candidatus Aminicenantes bacterium]